MEIKITTTTILRFLYWFSWLIFIGLCIETGSYLFNTYYALLYQPRAAEHYGLGEVLQVAPTPFVVIMTQLTVVALLKAILFYLIVKLIHDKKINLNAPFNPDMAQFLNRIGYLTLGISFFTFWGAQHIQLLAKQGMQVTSQQLLFSGADIWLFMCIVLLVIAQLFKKGIELQSENELTI